MKQVKKLATLLPLLLLSSVAAASITDVAPTDKSVEYLRYIFGSVVDIIIGGTGPASPDSIMGALSEILNSGMLVFTGLIVGYVFLTGVLNSAHEGNPLGKAYSTMWIPLRMVFALALVMPFAGGYSAMQIGVLWVAGHGIGLANSSWNKALDYMSASGTLYPPNVAINFEEIGASILESRVCMHGINTADRHVNVEEKPIEVVSGNSINNLRTPGKVGTVEMPPQHVVMQRYDSSYNFASAGLAYGAAFLSGFPNGVPRSYGANPCGSIKLEFAEIDSSTLIAPEVISFQKRIINAHADLDEQLDPLAREIVQKAVDANAADPDPLAFNTAVSVYKTEYLKAVNDALSSIATKRIDAFANGNPSTSNSTIGARDAGWISVGAFYWDLQRINGETQRIVTVKPELAAPTGDAQENSDYSLFDNQLNTYRQNMFIADASGNIVNALERSSYSADNIGLSVVMATITKSMDVVLSEPDPLAGLANLGHSIIGAFEAAFIASSISRRVAKTADDVADTVGGLSGGALRSVTSTVRGLLEDGMSIFLFAALLLCPLALMLAFYLPATPMILWIMGVVGWFTMLIEAVIAAPIWAASHAMPEGNGFVGQRAMAGYMVCLSVFLRPTLMILGFFASMVLIIVMAKVVILLFVPFMSGMLGDHLTGIVSLFAMLSIFTVLMVQISHRCFGLIHEVPDKVLRYIGGGAENLGESAQEQQSRNIFVGGAAKIVSQGERSARGGAADAASSMGDGVGKMAGGAKTAAQGGMSKVSKMLSTKT